MLIYGHAFIALFHFLVGFFTQYELHTCALVSMLLFIFTYANTDGPVALLWATEVTSDAALGLSYFALVGSILVLQMTTEFMMDSWLQPQGVFWLFSILGLMATVFCYVYMKDSTHVTEKEKKQLYMPKKYIEEEEALKPNRPEI